MRFWGVVCIIAALAGSSSARPRGLVILDSLEVSPATSFPIWGMSGSAITAEWHVGTELEVMKPVVIMEIGTIMNSCIDIVSGIAYCEGTLPFVIDVHREKDGAPDPDAIVATLPLTDDGEPLTLSYERWRGKLRLLPGKYFFLIAPQRPEDAGVLVQQICAPDPETELCIPYYVAGEIPVWWMNTASGYVSASVISSPFRIIGIPERRSSH